MNALISACPVTTSHGKPITAPTNYMLVSTGKTMPTQFVLVMESIYLEKQYFIGAGFNHAHPIGAVLCVTSVSARLLRMSRAMFGFLARELALHPVALCQTGRRGARFKCYDLAQLALLGRFLTFCQIWEGSRVIQKVINICQSK